MRTAFLPLFLCPVCKGDLHWESFDESGGEICEGCAWCSSCLNFYPIEDRLLELLPPELSYAEERKKFWQKHNLSRWKIPLQGPSPNARCAMQHTQQAHFDWYAANGTQTYKSYEELPFWQAADALTFSAWKKEIRPDSLLLDIGCAQGRSAFKFMDLPIDILGFDLSKASVRQAIERTQSQTLSAKASFFCADAASLPFKPNSFDAILVYGVLHHLPDPESSCRQIAEILKTGGLYFGSENNQTVFRSLFDLLMKLKPLWYEEAGAEPLISSRQLSNWFERRMEIKTDTHVFIPPHLVNMLGPKFGFRLLRWTDWLGQKIPGIRKNGGLIRCRGKKIA